MSYFTIEELCRSSVAKAKGIDNSPPPEIVENLEILIYFLNKVREEFGASITVSSGYRCNALNKAVGGVPNSWHTKGLAADLVSRDQKKLWKILKKHELEELLWENGGEWIHVAIYATHHIK